MMAISLRKCLLKFFDKKNIRKEHRRTTEVEQTLTKML